MLTIDEARARVARGAAHLDATRPGWHDRIDLGTLTLSDPCSCVVGQLCHSTRFMLDETGALTDGFPWERLFPNKIVKGQLVEKVNAWHWGVDLAPWAVGPDGAYLSGDAWDNVSGGCPVHTKAYHLLQDAWIEAIADRRLRSTVPVGELVLAEIGGR